MIITKRHIALIILLIITMICIIFGITMNKSEQTFNNSKFKIVLDAGHGAPDGGAVGINGTEEKDINLALVLKLEEILEGNGFNVILTRTGDCGVYDDDKKTIRDMKVSDMNNRLKIIKDSNADLFLSIHMNSFENKNVTGLNVFYDTNHPDIEKLAEEIQNNMGNVTGAKIHAVKTADTKLFLMKNSPVPSILIECGFLSNEDEEKKLNDDEYQSKIAWAIAYAIENYIKN